MVVTAHCICDFHRFVDVSVGAGLARPFNIFDFGRLKLAPTTLSGELQKFFLTKIFISVKIYLIKYPKTVGDLLSRS